MTNDDEWVRDVKRWYFAPPAAPLGARADAPATDYSADLGYEAAHPALQARHWPEAATLGTALTTDR